MFNMSNYGLNNSINRNSMSFSGERVTDFNQLELGHVITTRVHIDDRPNRYLVEGFDGDKVILSELWATNEIKDRTTLPFKNLRWYITEIIGKAQKSLPTIKIP